MLYWQFMVCGLLFKIFDKSDDFNFLIVNLPFICSNIPAALAYGVYISQLIRYYRACGTYQDFLDRGFVLRRKLQSQGFFIVQLKAHFESLTVATMTWLSDREYMCHNGRRICSTCGKHLRSFPHSWLIAGFATRLTQHVWLVLSHPEHLSSTPF